MRYGTSSVTLAYSHCQEVASAGWYRSVNIAGLDTHRSSELVTNPYSSTEVANDNHQ